MALKKIKEEVEEVEVATTDRLIQATKIISEKFGLDSSYQVTKFNDKGHSVDITLENMEFTISASIKNAEIYMQ